MELIFVYNAKSTIAHRLFVALHKSISPSTYNCDLCSLTHGNIGATKAWEDFYSRSGIPIRLFYKDQFQKYFQKEIEYPAVMTYEYSALNCILGPKELSSINDLNELFVLLLEKVPELKN